jgi:hypothetical protein
VLYGIVSATDASAARNAARRIDPGVRLVETDRFAALVGPGDRGDARDRMLAHFDLLATVAAVVDVLPVRFGVLAGVDDRAREALASRSEAIEATLDRLRGLVEMRVRAAYRQDDVLLDIAGARPDVRRLSEATRGRATTAERLQLGRLVVGALERRRQRDAPRLTRLLLPLASDVRAAPSLLETEVVRASFLVRRERVDRFRQVAEGADADGVRMLVVVTGPIPPWSFVDAAEATAPGRRRRGA